MAYRDRTGLYITFRQSYAHHGQKLEFSKWDQKEERQNLIHKDVDDNVVIEMDMLAPKWVAVESDINFLLQNTQRNIQSLDKQYAKHVLPSFSDKTEQENEIQRLTIDITSDFQKCHRILQTTKRQTKTIQGSEALVAQNLLANLASRIQTESAQFRKKQSTYLKKLRGLNSDFSSSDAKLEDTVSDVAISQSTIQQAALMEEQGEDERAVQHERAIAKIAEGILELAQMFQDLQGLVIEQGALVDRIDFNVEQTQVHAKSAEKELTKAEGHQRNTGRLRFMCILVLIIIALLIILIGKLAR
ncbi:SNARE Tlg2 [Schizosaccharomyces cryophilus OY26]|uniref:SNARE Tlg2 n=1 Tax=Schizosaccharomyces cryophilus (strain OY26 / ATCC MYA-4695 / CBS 11777 / NBRC 106824 / NRRL Y48691) TaxID=653667 RepID=S9W388_SCHCR|nr:SNARE Tlg2 [Schizosaccharomyces cryophilus OY26]EPY52410.1 SNARE Tlg2 [Schizosaccharomyces cryophilus OY26]